MATYTLTRLYLGQPGTSGAAIVTPAANTTDQVKEIWLTNTTGNPATVTLGVNGTAAANQFVPTISVPANDTKIITGLNIPLVASNGDTLQALQGTASAVTVMVNGVVIS